MIRRFRVRIEGRDYEVEVEEIGGRDAPAERHATERHATERVAPPSPPLSPSPPVTAPGSSPAPAGDLAAGAVTAPLPGVVLEVKVKQGQVVAPGEILCVLEAMKMENEVTASRAGTVAEVRVARGAAVNAGDVLFVVS